MSKWLWLVALSALALAGFGMSQAPPAARAGGLLAQAEGPEGTGAAPTPAPEATEDPGAYLVATVVGCEGCHTPRDASGALDRTRWMAGMPVFMDLAPDDDAVGVIPSPNLTPDPTGLGGWTDEQIRRAITDGVDADGEPLFPIMPYWVYHNLSAEDADAVVAYLHGLTPVANEIPERQPLPMPFDAPAPVLGDDMIPRSTLAADDPRAPIAERGRYLTTLACLGCHTAAAQGAPLPVQTEFLLAGGRSFGPPDHEVVSSNLTPDAHGLAGWTPEDIVNALLEGRDKEGHGICRPMPSGPEGHFGHLTPQDALAIGTYLTTIPAVDHGELPDCETE